MTNRIATLAFAALFFVFGGIAEAQCPPSCPIPGGGDETTNCLSELASTAMHLNSPFFNPAKPKPAKEHRCFDGDPGCDLDAEANGVCVFDVDVCLRNADPELPSCTPADVIAFDIKGESKFAGLAVLEAAGQALLPAVSNVCTTGQSVTLPLKQKSNGVFKRSNLKLKVVADSAGGRDKDTVKLSCVPRDWPTHGFDHRNRRNNPLESTLNPGNVGALVPQWSFFPSGNPVVTSTPTVGPKLVYVTAWDGVLYALSRKNGKAKWSYDTGTGSFAGLFPGIQTSATLTAEGRVIITDADAIVHCLDAKKGKLLWQANIGDTVADAAHGWSSATVANGRVFIGRASHEDDPCTQGHLYAFDLDTGAELWRTATVAEAICNHDTNIECTTNADCGGGNTCVPGRGGGVTAMAATSDDGETLYISAIGCASYPSIGTADSVYSMDAATGAINWINRPQPPQQFSDGPPYNDYGFVNGPAVITVSDGMAGTQELVVAGSKDGTLYAMDPDTGATVWTNELLPPSAFAGFGLFNGAIGFADGKLYASMYDMTLVPSADNLDRVWAFDGTDGSHVWSAGEDKYSWAHVGLAGGMLFTGGAANSIEFNIYDGSNGTLLKTFGVGAFLEAPVGGPSIVDGTVFAPSGVFGSSGGVRAFGLP
jgi:outer membrane protein assembly factor BamB